MRQKTGYISRYLLLTTPSCHADITRQYTVYWEITMKVLCSLFSVSIGNHSSDYEQAVALSVYSEVRSVIVSSFIKNVHQFIMYPARPFCLLADGLTVKSFFSSRKAQIHSFYTELLKTLKLMLSNAVFLFKTISSCKKNFHRLFYRTTQFTRGGSGQAGCLSS